MVYLYKCRGNKPSPSAMLITRFTLKTLILSDQYNLRNMNDYYELFVYQIIFFVKSYFEYINIICVDDENIFNTYSNWDLEFNFVNYYVPNVSTLINNNYIYVFIFVFNVQVCCISLLL